jgi:hypothetical protein
VILPALKGPVRSFWSCGTGWGSFRLDAAGANVTLAVDEGELPLRSVKIRGGLAELREEVRIRAGEEKKFSARL